MRRLLPLLALWAALLAAAVAIVVLAGRPPPPPDVVGANALVQIAEENWARRPLAETDFPASLSAFTIVDRDGAVVAVRGPAITTDLDAVRSRAFGLDIVVNGEVVGRGYLLDTEPAAHAGQLATIAGIALCVLLAVGLVATGYAWWVDRRVLRPFRRLRAFATRVAHGDLDAPLTMDRGNAFGAFSESFDVLRAELSRSRAAEAKAALHSRELAAELSHDLRTPLASLHMAAELGLLAGDDRTRPRFTTIINHANRLTEMVDDLCRVGEELDADLSVSPQPMAGSRVCALVAAADVRGALASCRVPDALVVADPMRLQQVIDNVVSNAAKYAPGPIRVTGRVADDLFWVSIEDNGPGVPESELSLILGRHVRGAGAAGQPGQGLGLYIAERLLASMGGALTVRNSGHGLAVELALPMAGGIHDPLLHPVDQARPEALVRPAGD